MNWCCSYCVTHLKNLKKRELKYQNILYDKIKNIRFFYFQNFKFNNYISCVILTCTIIIQQCVFLHVSVSPQVDDISARQISLSYYCKHCTCTQKLFIYYLLFLEMAKDMPCVMFQSAMDVTSVKSAIGCTPMNLYLLQHRFKKKSNSLLTTKCHW